MDIRKKVITGVAVLTFGAALAFAAPHEGGRGGHRRGAMGARFAEKLDLTDAQKSQIKSIREAEREKNKPLFDAHRETMKSLREAKQASDAAKVDALQAKAEAEREQLEQARQASKQQILSVLTPEQKSQFEAMEAKRGERGMRGHRRGGKHGRQGAALRGRMAEELNLTDAQKAEMRQIHQSTRESNKAFFESHRETMKQLRDAKKADDTAKIESLKATAQAQREQMKQLRQAEMAKIESILTPEQKAKLEAKKANRQHRRGREF